MLRTSHTLVLLTLMAIGSPCYAMKPMTNDEIRQEIMKGALKDYENGACPADFVMKPEAPVQVSQSSGQSAQSSSSEKKSTQSSQGVGVTAWDFGPAYSIASAIGQTEESSRSHSQGGSQSESKSYTEFPGTCTCPCPYSKDLKGKECGDSSAYFKFPDTIPCYPSDIKDWQISEYRESYEIPDPTQLAPKPAAEPSDKK